MPHHSEAKRTPEFNLPIASLLEADVSLDGNTGIRQNRKYYDRLTKTSTVTFPPVGLNVLPQLKIETQPTESGLELGEDIIFNPQILGSRKELADLSRAWKYPVEKIIRILSCTLGPVCVVGKEISFYVSPAKATMPAVIIEDGYLPQPIGCVSTFGLKINPDGQLTNMFMDFNGRLTPDRDHNLRCGLIYPTDNPVATVRKLAEQVVREIAYPDLPGSSLKDMTELFKPYLQIDGALDEPPSFE